MEEKVLKNQDSALVLRNLIRPNNFSCLDSVNKVLSITHLAQQLKNELRHGWTDMGRQESVADHSWRLALLVMLCSPHLDQNIELEKALIMAVIHDIVEAEVGDRHFLSQNYNQEAKELKAIKRIKDFLNNSIGNLFFEYWVEFNTLSSYEAKVVRALDKIEGYVQQNEADLGTWTDEEMVSVFYYMDDFCDFDSFLKHLKEATISETKLKLINHNIDVESIIEKANMVKKQRAC